ncbi:MAG: pseudouridine synthase [Cytophagales bacterium]|nr:pseudouridine synthase [Cytophagales bacterium]
MSKKSFKYFLVHKPYKVLSQFSSDEGNPGLGSLFDLPKDVYPVGRLDMDSEGLLLLTNDKTINNKLLDPKHGHVRIYRVEVEGTPDEDELNQLRRGVEINLKGKKHQSKPCEAKILKKFKLPEREPSVNRVKHPSTTWLEIKLTEGKNRQIRRMTAKIGHPTLRLIRFGIEDLELGTLNSGEIIGVSANVIYAKLKLKN